MKIKTLFASILAASCLIMTACNPKEAPKSSTEPVSSEVQPASEDSSVPAPESSEPAQVSSEPAPMSSEPAPASSEPAPASSEPTPVPLADPIALTAANLMGYAGINISYKDGDATVGQIKFNYIECGAYGNGIQMRTKSGKSSTIYNVDAFPGAVKSVKITLNKDKTVYDNEHALTFTFGATAECADKSITWDTVKDTLSYEFNVGAEGCKYFKLVHSITYSLYVDSIELIF